MSVEIGKETAKTNKLYHGHTKAGLTAVPLCLDFGTHKGILVRAAGPLELSDEDAGNEAAVWIGGAGVTADLSETGGIPLMPGRSIVIPVDDPSGLFIISSAVDQDVAWMGV